MNSFPSLTVLDNYTEMLWKNGLGKTDQIFISPQGSDISNFDWRISSATFSSSGPFSHFDGYSRILVQLEGEPMHLFHLRNDKNTEKVLSLLEVYHFDGSVDTSSIVTGIVKDFNLIFKKNEFQASTTVTQIKKGTTQNSCEIIETNQFSEVFLFVASGSLKIEGIENELKKYQTLHLHNWYRSLSMFATEDCQLVICSLGRIHNKLERE
jgi:environmental stress-induced protein Ves